MNTTKNTLILLSDTTSQETINQPGHLMEIIHNQRVTDEHRRIIFMGVKKLPEIITRTENTVLPDLVLVSEKGALAAIKEKLDEGQQQGVTVVVILDPQQKELLTTRALMTWAHDSLEIISL